MFYGIPIWSLRKKFTILCQLLCDPYYKYVLVCAKNYHVPDSRVLIPKIAMVTKAESDPTLTRTLGILSILGLPEVQKPYWTV